MERRKERVRASLTAMNAVQIIALFIIVCLLIFFATVDVKDSGGHRTPAQTDRLQ